MGRRGQTKLPERDMEPLARLLGQLPPESLDTLVSLARRISEGSGRRPGHTEGSRIGAPTEGIPFWVAKMKSERYSGGTIRVYRYLVERYLKSDPTPTKLGIPALPVHDSVIAPTRHREVARQTMEGTYRRHTGFGITVE